MFKHLESPAVSSSGWLQMRADFGTTYAANALIGFIFAATGPVAVILSVGTRGGLSPDELASWVSVLASARLLRAIAKVVSGNTPSASVLYFPRKR